MTAPLPRPHLVPLFSGRTFADVLDDEYARALADVYRLEPSDFTATDDTGAPLTLTPQDLADTITTTHTPDMPTIVWDVPIIRTGTTEDQRVRVVISWRVAGPTAPLTWAPAQHWIGGDTRATGLANGRIVTYRESYDISQDAMLKIMQQSHRYVSTHLDYQWEQRQEWAAQVNVRMRDAITRRRELLERVEALAE